MVATAILLFSLLLGVSFFLISQGLLFGVLWFAPNNEQAYKLLCILLNKQNQDVKFIRLPIPRYRYFILIIKAILILYAIYLGFCILVTNGFLQQNVIYMIFHH